MEYLVNNRGLPEDEWEDKLKGKRFGFGWYVNGTRRVVVQRDRVNEDEDVHVHGNDGAGDFDENRRRDVSRVSRLKFLITKPFRSCLRKRQLGQDPSDSHDTNEDVNDNAEAPQPKKGKAREIVIDVERGDPALEALEIKPDERPCWDCLAGKCPDCNPPRLSNTDIDAHSGSSSISHTHFCSLSVPMPQSTTTPSPLRTPHLVLDTGGISTSIPRSPLDSGLDHIPPTSPGPFSATNSAEGMDLGSDISDGGNPHVDVENWLRGLPGRACPCKELIEKMASRSMAKNLVVASKKIHVTPMATNDTVPSDSTVTTAPGPSAAAAIAASAGPVSSSAAPLAGPANEGSTYRKAHHTD